MSVRVAVPDRAGRLRVVASLGESDYRRRAGTTRRRRAFSTGRPVAVPAHGSHGRALHVLPLRAGDQTLGVVEVDAPSERLVERHDAVLALVRQSAALLRLSTERAAADQDVLAMKRLLDVVRRLSAARTTVDAMRIVANACWTHLRAAVAVVRPDRSGRGWFLGSTGGITADAGALLAAHLSTCRPDGGWDDQASELTAAFRDAVGRAADAWQAGDCVLLLDARASDGRFIRFAASQLERTVEHLSGRTGQTTQADVGIAWTAHELRRPLVGAKAVLDHLMTTGTGPEAFDLLRRTKAELDQLTDLVDPLLEWSGGSGGIRRRPADLVEVVDQAVTSCSFDVARGRIRFDAPDPVPVECDVVQLRSAIANVLRNALAYSPRSAPVEVEIEDDGALARVYIRDEGPGIGPEERAAVFEPFVRGSDAGRAASGHGLGLFIARRVAEAHGGTIRLEPRGSGTTFCFELPISVRELQRV